MTVEILGGTLLGVEGVVVRVEVDVLSMLPSFQVVGLPLSSVKEARERVRSAIESADLPYPRRRIVANLAPAGLPKAGTGLDLPRDCGDVLAMIEYATPLLIRDVSLMNYDMGTGSGRANGSHARGPTAARHPRLCRAARMDW